MDILILLLAIGHDGGNEIGALGKGLADDILAHGVQHADGPQGGVGQGGLNVRGVGGGLDAIDDNVAVHGVGIVQTIGPDGGHTSHLVSSASGGDELITSLDNAGNSHAAIDIQVVVASQGDSAATSSGDADKLGTNSRQLVGEHEHIAEFTSLGKDLIADTQSIHALGRTILQLNSRVGREAGLFRR